MDLNYDTSYTFRIPNELIHDPSPNKKILLTYIHIHRQRLYEGGAGIALEMLIEENGYTAGQRHRTIKQFKESLQHLMDMDMIVLSQPVDSYSIRDYIGDELLKGYIPSGNYTQISVKEITTMLDRRNGVDPANLVATYLFIKSKIGSQRQAFCCTQDSVVEGLHLSISTVKRCCTCLEKLGLIGIHNGCYVRQGKRAYMPNIYVLKGPGWEEALAEQVKYLESNYNVHLMREEAILH